MRTHGKDALSDPELLIRGKELEVAHLLTGLDLRDNALWLFPLLQNHLTLSQRLQASWRLQSAAIKHGVFIATHANELKKELRNIKRLRALRRSCVRRTPQQVEKRCHELI